MHRLFIVAFVILGLNAYSPLSKAAPVTDFKEIAGKQWQLTTLKLNDKKIDLSKKVITLQFNDAGKTSGKSAVNSYFGELKLDGTGECNWGKGMGATRMAGPPEMMRLEQQYFEAIVQTSMADLIAGILTFTSKDTRTTCVFAAHEDAIEGQIIFKADPDGPLGPDMKITVTLQDVSLADVAAKEIGKVVITTAKGFPVKFKIPYSKDLIRPRMRYAISARIEDGKGLCYINDTHHPVFKDSNKPPSKPVDLAVIRIRQ